MIRTMPLGIAAAAFFFGEMLVAAPTRPATSTDFANTDRGVQGR
jgi:threonine/homoserine efflux transporter RhtA